jgi:hypothetical protein
MLKLAETLKLLKQAALRRKPNPLETNGMKNKGVPVND